MRWLMAILLVVALASCGGDGTEGENARADGTSMTTPGGAGDDADADAAREVCEFVQQELDTLREEGASGVGALGKFAQDFAAFIAENPDQQLSGSRLDAVTRDGCPEARTEILELLGVENLDAV